MSLFKIAMPVLTRSIVSPSRAITEYAWHSLFIQSLLPSRRQVVLGPLT